jgi:acyl carrier protein
MKEKVKKLVLDTVIEILQQNGKETNTDNFKLYSKDGLFDSMDLVNFISLLEDKLFAQHNKTIQLSHPSIFSSSKSPFKDIDSTIEFIMSLI